LLHDQRASQLTVALVTTVTGLLVQKNVVEENKPEPESVTTQLLKMGEKTV
jgi:hypothetical protein